MTELVRSVLVAAALTAAALPAAAATIGIAELNNTAATAQNVDAYFSLDFSPDIGDTYGTNTSLVLPHVTIDATGTHANNGAEYDWYSFTVAGVMPYNGWKAIFDIDYGMDETVIESIDPPGWLRADLRLLDPSGNQIGLVQPFDRLTAGAGGSVNNADPFAEIALFQAGVYRIGVGAGPNQFLSLFDPSENPFGANPDYVLQISVQDHELAQLEATPVPEPASLTLLGAGLLAGYRSLRKRQVRAQS